MNERILQFTYRWQKLQREQIQINTLTHQQHTHAHSDKHAREHTQTLTHIQEALIIRSFDYPRFETKIKLSNQVKLVVNPWYTWYRTNGSRGAKA